MLKVWHKRPLNLCAFVRVFRFVQDDVAVAKEKDVPFGRPSANIVAAGVPFDVVYTLESNKWMDRETLQLNIKDVRETV